MKKQHFFMAAVAGLALTGCVNNEADGIVNGDNQAIAFNAPVVAANSRVAGEMTNPYDKAEKFSVFAYATDGDFQKWENGPLYMDDVECGYNATYNGWTPSTIYYWPKSQKLTFAAYSPSSVAASYGAAGLTANGFEVADNVADQIDFMYSERSYNRTASTGGTSYSGVDLKFQHALSSIRFKAKANADYAGTTLKITSITLNDVKSKGNFAETVTDGATYAAAPAWSSQSDAKNYSVWTGNQTVTTTVADVYTSDVILIPQELSGVTATVTYTITNPGGVTLNETATLTLGTSEWEIGKRYNYTLNLGLNEIYFSPEVEAWTDVNGNGNI